MLDAFIPPRLTPLLLAEVHPLATTNASLNALATLLLVAGFVCIKRGKVAAHKRCMLAAFGVSSVFLVCYLVYHYLEGSKAYAGQGVARYVYFTILITHIVLAAAVPVLAIWTIVLGLADRRDRHRRMARWTFPIWLYVSLTGVVIYVMLYWL